MEKSRNFLALWDPVIQGDTLAPDPGVDRIRNMCPQTFLGTIMSDKLHSYSIISLELMLAIFPSQWESLPVIKSTQRKEESRDTETKFSTPSDYVTYTPPEDISPGLSDP